MAQTERQKRAEIFVKTWINKIKETPENQSNERQFCQLFWTSLLKEVFVIDNIADFIDFERPVPKESHSGKNFIDGYIPSTKVLIEQKGSKIDLSRGEKQSDGQSLSPYQQAKRYGSSQNYSERPRWIIVSNFISFEIHDMEKPNDAPYVIKLENLPKELHNLSMIYDAGKKEIIEEMALSVEAGKIVRQLYDILSAKYNNSPEHQRSLNMLCVRLVFLLYADDAMLFGEKGVFHRFVESFSAENLSDGITKLFAVLNTKEDDRKNKYFNLDNKFDQFPWINGNLFSEQDNLIPQFTEEFKQLLLEKGHFNWRDISPTIFGAVFESTLNPETRHDGGMHYTSIENIHKVIDPLFLDNFKAEFQEIKDLENQDIKSDIESQKKNIRLKDKFKEKYKTLQSKLSSIKIFDPACGSGNFLTESYISLRKLENEILRETLDIGFFSEQVIKVSIQQFYGIEINDFAVSVAKTALWIAEAQMFLETEKIINSHTKFFPLEAYINIVEGNALRLDWKTIVPSDLTYIIGNPPFLGARVMKEQQKQDVIETFGTKLKGVGNLDYVSCWYKKCTELMKGTQIKSALVSTNSITQGEQPAVLWKPLFDDGIKINFAYRTFKWNSESKDKAQVYCVIICFSYQDSNNKIIFDDKVKITAKNINAYLLDYKSIFIESRTKPICNVPEIGIGNQPIDGGNYLFTEEEMQEFLKKEPEAEKFFRKWIGSDEFIKGYNRYCLYLSNTNPSEIVKMPKVMKRIKAVEEYRRNSPRKSTQKIADTPTKFQVENVPDTNYIVIPEVSTQKRKYIPIGFFTPDILSSNLVKVMPNATIYDFGILTSNVHNAWIKVVCGRLGNGYRYSKDIVYNNFPWCTPTAEQKLKIEQTTQDILDARTKYPDASLGDMYSNLLLFPELNKAHKANDFAVMEAYGFNRKITEVQCVAELFKMYQKLTNK